MPIRQRLAPRFAAAWTTAPRRKVSSSKGWDRFGGSIASPITVADSMMAVLVRGSHHHVATHGRWAASTVLTCWILALSSVLVTSPNPSPPSLMGSRLSESPARALRQPRAIASAAAAAVRVPLSLSGVIKTFSAMSAPTVQSPPLKVKFDLQRKYGSVVVIINYD